MRKILIAILLCAVSIVTANATVTSENSILTIKNETLHSIDTSTPVSNWSPKGSKNEGGEGWSYNADYSISNRVATLNGQAIGFGNDSGDPSRYYPSAEANFRNTFNRIPLNRARGYVKYSNGLIGIHTFDYLELRTSNNENSIRMLNVNNGTTYAQSFSLVSYPNLWCDKRDRYRWYCSVYDYTSSVTGNLTAAPISITIPDVYIQNANCSPGIRITATDVQATDLIATAMDVAVTGSANLSRVSGNSLTLNHTGNTLNVTTLSVGGNATITHNATGTPFKLKDLTLGTFNLNYKSTNTPEDPAIQPGSTSDIPVAELEKVRVTGNSSIQGTNDSYLFMKQCTATGSMTFSGNQEVYIDGGTYKGSPAISGNNVTIKRGVLTDIGNTTSKFMVDPDSDAQVATANGQTITTVKLSNPPVIIDWADFPGIFSAQMRNYSIHSVAITV